MLRVSIVTPSFNQAVFLEQTLLSVLDQEYPSIQYIVMDGASTDSSVDIIRKYGRRLAFWESRPDEGQADAINKGIDLADGEILAWLNSDDYYLPGAIAQVVKVFEQNPDVVLVYGDMLAVDETGNTINELKYSQLKLEDLLCFQIVGQPSVFMRRSAMGEVRLNKSFHFLLDHLLWIQLAQRGRIMHIPEFWSAARYHAGAKNRAKAAEFGQEAFRILDLIEKDPALAPVLKNVYCRSRASAHRVDARYLLDGGLPRKALLAWFRAFIIYPPVALVRLNIFISAMLSIFGLEKIRAIILKKREDRYKL